MHFYDTRARGFGRKPWLEFGYRAAPPKPGSKSSRSNGGAPRPAGGSHSMSTASASAPATSVSKLGSRYVRGSTVHSLFARGYADGVVLVWDLRNGAQKVRVCVWRRGAPAGYCLPPLSLAFALANSARASRPCRRCSSARISSGRRKSHTRFSRAPTWSPMGDTRRRSGSRSAGDRLVAAVWQWLGLAGPGLRVGGARRASMCKLRCAELNAGFLLGGSGNCWDGSGLISAGSCRLRMPHEPRDAPRARAAGSLGTLPLGTPHVGSGSMLLWHGRVCEFARARCSWPVAAARDHGRMHMGVLHTCKCNMPCCRSLRGSGPSFCSLRALSAGHITNRQNERGGCPMPARAEWSSEDPCRARTDTSYRLVRTNYTNAGLQRRLGHP